MGYPDECNLCILKEINPDLANEKLKLSVRPYQGKNPYIMLVGRDPTVEGEEAKTVFQLDDKNNRYKHIHPDILKIINDDFYATNLVKCTFPQEPTRFCKKVYGNGDTKTVKTFLLPFLQKCRRYFSEEFAEIRPKILMSFGEVPHQLIVEGFEVIGQSIDKNMKMAFSNIYRVNLLDQDIRYVPCIRKKALARPYFKNLWPEFIKNLRETLNSVS